MCVELSCVGTCMYVRRMLTGVRAWHPTCAVSVTDRREIAHLAI